MGEIHKKIVTDEDMNPVAVQIEYEDWLAIEHQLNLDTARKTPTDLSRHAGRLDWPVDGLEYQHRVRSEWD